jgi:serine/threonine-protein kinase
MGEVWRAKHRMLARPAAIKLISPEMLGAGGELGSTLIRRFEKEAQTTATLQSQHTIQLYDFGVTDEGALYYVMEYLEGVDLQTLVDKYGPVPPERAVYLLLQILESLDEAHKAGLVHRDIKPANIFASKYGLHYDFIKVLDFGLARFSGPSDQATTVADAGVGTPAFMAPESATNGADVDARADLYAVGAVAYWMLTGKPVFEGPTPYAVILDHLRTPPIPPSQRMETELPPALEQIIMACLEKEPANRPRSASELAERLRAVRFVTPWTAQRAESWWLMHRPTSAPAETPAPVFEKAIA